MSNVLDESPGAFRIFPELDHGIEWCEDRILVEGHLPIDGKRWTLTDLLATTAQTARLDKIGTYFDCLSIPKGQHIIRQGDAGADLYFIESGQVTVRVELEGGRSVRLRTMGAGTVVGEMGLYLHQVRSASVVADELTVVQRLSAEALHRMEQSDPETAAALHRFMAHLLAERLANTNKALQALFD